MKRDWRPAVRRTGLVLAVVIAVAVTFQAGRWSVGSATRATGIAGDATATAMTWTVENRSVGRSLSFTGKITPTTADGPTARASGVITSVLVGRSTSVKAGTPLYTVDLRPVHAGRGKVPAFRALSLGDEGADVRQLRGFLCAQGSPSVCGDSPLFDANLQSALMQWQRGAGLPADGTLQAGDILWFPTLPVRVRPTEALETGRNATPGDRPYRVDKGVPELELRVARDQAALIPVGAAVLVGDDQQAVVAGLGQVPAAAGDGAPGGEMLVRLARPASPEKQFCAVDTYCLRALGKEASVSVPIKVQTVPEQSGPAVPMAAIETDAAGQTSVRLVDGTRQEVSVVGSAGGIAVVTGLAVGATVAVPGPQAQK